MSYRPTTFAPFGVSSAASGVGCNLAAALVTLGDDAAAGLVRAALAASGDAYPFVLGAAAA